MLIPDFVQLRRYLGSMVKLPAIGMATHFSCVAHIVVWIIFGKLQLVSEISNHW